MHPYQVQRDLVLLKVKLEALPAYSSVWAVNL